MEDDREPDAPDASQDTRRIVRGVQLVGHGIDLRTYAPGNDPAMLDALEKLLSPSLCEQLKAEGFISGDWHPKGKEPPPRRK